MTQARAAGDHRARTQRRLERLVEVEDAIVDEPGDQCGEVGLDGAVDAKEGRTGEWTTRPVVPSRERQQARAARYHHDLRTVRGPVHSQLALDAVRGRVECRRGHGNAVSAMTRA